MRASTLIVKSLTYLFVAVSFAWTKPNLIVIMSDQHRYDIMSRYQEELGIPLQNRVKTPNLDKLSREGAYFRNAYTQCAVCAPARASILTGCTIDRTGIRSNADFDEALWTSTTDAAKNPLLASFDQILVKNEGYVAEYYGKWHTPQSLAYIYSNDVRMGGMASTWFGDYKADGTTKIMVPGLSTDFLAFLDSNHIPKNAPSVGQQLSTLTKRPYVTHSLDSRYGLAPDPVLPVDLGESVQHGMDLCPDGFSATVNESTQTLEALKRLSKSGKPFSLTVSFHFPHPPMLPTGKYYNMYDPKNMIPPASITDPMTNSAYANSNNRKTMGPGYQDPAKIRRWMADYYGLVTEVDEWIGKILDEIDNLGLKENTLVAYFSDHGELLGAHGLQSKNVFYEESAHIPLLLRMPGKIPQGVTINEPVTLIDLRNTFLDYLGVNPTNPSDGKSLRRFIEGTDSSDNFIVTEWRPENGPSFMIRKGNWKLMVPNTASSTVLDMLFNIKGDSLEVNNLVGKNGLTASDYTIGKAEHLKALLFEFLVRMGNPAASEIANRRNWKTVNLWVSDTAIDFGSVRSGHSITKELYLGRSTKGTTVISEVSLSGSNAGRFSINWTNSSIDSGVYKVLKITCRDNESGLAAGNTLLTIKHNGGGADKIVTLIPPLVTAVNPSIHASTGERISWPSVMYRSNALYVTSGNNRPWVINFYALSGQIIQKIEGHSDAIIPFKRKPGTYVVCIKAGGITRNFKIGTTK